MSDADYFVHYIISLCEFMIISVNLNLPLVPQQFYEVSHLHQESPPLVS